MKKQASNTFKDGLIMDYSPSATPDTILTNSLNGTLVTYNGNELMLQNDMGNSCINRVRLDEGYIPVGITEHGGVIYVASYNPKTEHGLIGSFPYPKVNFYPNDFDNNDDTYNWALKAYKLNLYTIKNKNGQLFLLPMFYNSIIEIPLLYKKETLEQFDIHSNDSFTNELSQPFKEFISLENVHAKYYVRAGGTKYYIDENLSDEDREAKIINGDIIYYSGKHIGKLYLEISLSTIDYFNLRLDLVENNGDLKVTFISNNLRDKDGNIIEDSYIPMYLHYLDDINSNAEDNNNVSAIEDKVKKYFNNSTSNIDVTVYPITKNYGIDGTNGRSVKFNPKQLLEQKEILSKYKYKWDEGKLTLDWSYLSILPEDQSDSTYSYIYSHYFFDINTVQRAINEVPALSSDFRELINNDIYKPIVVITQKDILDSVSGSFREEFNLPKGIFLHIIITTRVLNNIIKVRALRFVYATTFCNLYFEDENIKDYNNIYYTLFPKKEGGGRDPWIEYLNLDINDLVFKMDVNVNKAQYTEDGKVWKECSSIDPVIMQDTEVLGNNEFNINPIEFFNKVEVTFSPNTNNLDKIEINLNPTTYEEHIIDSSNIQIDKLSITINSIHDLPEFSDSNYAKLTSLTGIYDDYHLYENTNLLKINRGIYSGSSGGKLLIEKKITGLYPLYLSGLDNSNLIGFDDFLDHIISSYLSYKAGLAVADRPIAFVNKNGEKLFPDFTDDPEEPETEGVTILDYILNSLVKSTEFSLRDSKNSCFNIITGRIGYLNSSIRTFKVPTNIGNLVDTKYSTFCSPENENHTELHARGNWHLITIRDSNNIVRVLPYGGYPAFPYGYNDHCVYAITNGTYYEDVVKLNSASNNYVNYGGDPIMFWIPPHLKLYNFLSQIFTLRTTIGNYYIIGADGINTVYSIPDKSFFKYIFPEVKLNNFIKTTLYNIALKTSTNKTPLNTSISRITLDASCIPLIRIAQLNNIFYYGNYLNLKESLYKYIVDRYTSVYDITQDVIVEDSNVTEGDIFIFDWRKLSDPNLIGQLYDTDGSYKGLHITEVVGFNPKDSSYVFNTLNAKKYLTNSKDIDTKFNGDKITVLKDWNGYDFFISNIYDNFITVFAAKKKKPGYFNLEDNGILLKSETPNFNKPFVWVEGNDGDAFHWVDICLYNHDMRETPYSSNNRYLRYSNNNKVPFLTQEWSGSGRIPTNTRHNIVKMNPNVLKKLYNTIQSSMLNYAKQL